MTTTRTRKVITAIDANGKAFAEIHRETQVGERWYPDDPIPLELGGADAASWQAEFNAALQAENTTIKAGSETLKADHAATVAALKDDHAATVANLSERITALTAELAAVATERDAAVSQIPPEPLAREVTPSEFVMRIMTAAPQALKQIWTSNADIAAVAAATLFTWPGRINLDSERLAQMLAGLVQANLLTAEEVATILA